MPIGVIVNALSIAFGGVIGALLSERMPERLKNELTGVFGLCAMGMGIKAVVLMENMPAVIMAMIVGTMLGLYWQIGEKITSGLHRLEKPLGNMMNIKKDKEAYMMEFITVLVVFVASATGIYGCLDAGISQDHTILISKSILDLFTAIIFACSLGMAVSLIAIPQCILFLLVFYLARFIYPLTTPTMILDFKACGGLLIIAAGMRMMKLKNFAVADMIPAMVLIMPMSWLWTSYIAPML